MTEQGLRARASAPLGVGREAPRRAKIPLRLASRSFATPSLMPCSCRRAEAVINRTLASCCTSIGTEFSHHTSLQICRGMPDRLRTPLCILLLPAWQTAAQLATCLPFSSHLSRLQREVGRPAGAQGLRRDAEHGAVEEHAAVGPQQTRRRLPPAAAVIDHQRRRLQPHPQRPCKLRHRGGR